MAVQSESLPLGRRSLSSSEVCEVWNSQTKPQVKFAEASEVSEVVRSEVFEVLLTEVGEACEARRRTGAVSLHKG
jgi:hypothetical protein